MQIIMSSLTSRMFFPSLHKSVPCRPPVRQNKVFTIIDSYFTSVARWMLRCVGWLLLLLLSPYLCLCLNHHLIIFILFLITITMIINITIIIIIVKSPPWSPFYAVVGQTFCEQGWTCCQKHSNEVEIFAQQRLQIPVLLLVSFLVISPVRHTGLPNLWKKIFLDHLFF